MSVSKRTAGKKLNRASSRNTGPQAEHRLGQAEKRLGKSRNREQNTGRIRRFTAGFLFLFANCASWALKCAEMSLF